MPFADHNSGNMTSSLRILLISTIVLSVAIMLKLSAPAITDFAVSDVSSLWNGVVAWLKPPYLYLVINCIIVSIVASSRFQSKSGGHVSPSPTLSHESYVQVQPAEGFESKSAFDNVVLGGGDAVEAATPTPPPRTDVLSTVVAYDPVHFGAYGHVDARVSETEEAFTVKAAAAEDEMEMQISNEFVISKSNWTSPVSNTPPEYSPVSAQKPPPSARFGHRRKASIEGGKVALRVSKPKRQDTLESTWKTITEGRAMPLTRHLRKSDTWETQGRRSRHHEVGAAITPPQKMKKSETFSDRTETSLLSPSPGRPSKLRKEPSLKKEPSLSQDELNRRVEAFIKKFNEEMRLQRQESLNQYMEMINRGSH